ncbi:DUF1080 domain-containing protein [Chitinophaga silvatica]|uniref:DUF1080 domain-containing protein n=1 Tax=Chitinophaga silvatica TaxID=2282649 RepID=A0A3E1Y350_9BACT|nr:DUF1080 domain-containing protein [Chitinophaga silvatica]RFS18927.1 DUF1080 domain-containing protein [Chitinophaga silvatica]
MRKKTGVLCLSVAVALIGTSVAWKTTQSMDYKKGFVSIFDGKTLNGWEHDGVHWKVEDGNLVGEITPETVLKTNNFIIWKGGQPANFELTCEFKISAGGNSGINYRSDKVENVPFALKGYQADIDGNNNYTGQNYEERGRTTLAYRGQKTVIPQPSGQESPKNNAWPAAKLVGSLGDIDSLKTLIKKEDWNTCRLVIKGNHLQHYINGVLMSDVTDNDKVNGKTSGYLGMQVHVGPPSKVAYRKIMIKQL